MRPFSMFDTVDQSAAPPSFGALRKNQSSEDILRDAQVLRGTPVLTCAVILNVAFRRVQGRREGGQEHRSPHLEG